MTHLDDGRLRAMMDDELSDSDASSVRLHLEDCNPCVTRLAELEERSALVARALTQLDTAAPPTGAHSAVLERIEASRPSRASRPTRHDTRAEPPRSDGRGRFSRTPFARAAMLTLFLGASVATALPASPVRGWIASGWARAVDLFSSPENALTPVSPPEYGGPISNGDVGARYHRRRDLCGTSRDRLGHHDCGSYGAREGGWGIRGRSRHFPYGRGAHRGAQCRGRRLRGPSSGSHVRIDRGERWYIPQNGRRTHRRDGYDPVEND